MGLCSALASAALERFHSAFCIQSSLLRTSVFYHAHCPILLRFASNLLSIPYPSPTSEASFFFSHCCNSKIWTITRVSSHLTKASSNYRVTIATHNFGGLKHFEWKLMRKEIWCMQSTEILTLGRKIPWSFPKGIGVEENTELRKGLWHKTNLWRRWINDIAQLSATKNETERSVCPWFGLLSRNVFTL